MNIFTFHVRTIVFYWRKQFPNMSVMSKRPSEIVFEASFTDDSTLWPEWSDAALNKEDWAYPKSN